MERSITKKAMAALAAAMMTCALGATALAPQSAQAAEPAATPLTTQATATDDSLATQAAKKTVYLRTKAGSTKYSYNSNGLISKISGSYDTWTFKYSGTKMISAVHKTTGGTYSNSESYKLAYDSKGRVKKITNVDNYTQTMKYNSKNRVTKVVKKTIGMSGSETSKYTYNSKGLVTKVVDPYRTTKIEYDSKGNPTGASIVSKGGYGINRYLTYENSYSSGRIAKITTSMNGAGDPLTTKISYKSKKLTKKYAAAAKAQQKALRVSTPNSILPLNV